MMAAFVGLVVGVVVGLTSMGGGALLTPALVLLLGVPPGVAVGSDVLIASVMKLVGSGVYAQRGQVHWQTVGRLATGSLPGAFVGILVLNAMPVQWVDTFVGKGLGCAMVAATACTLYRLWREAPPEGLPWPRREMTVALGFATGLVVAMTSVGSGSLLICVLFFFYPLRTPTMVGTDLANALILSVGVTLGHGLSGRVDVALAASVLVGALPGVFIGARVAHRVPERALRLGLAVVLAFIGLRLVSAPLRPLELEHLPFTPAAAMEP